MLIQAFHQNKNNHDEIKMLEQEQIGDDGDFQKWCLELKKNYPLPEGMDWLFVPEGDERFEYTFKENK